MRISKGKGKGYWYVWVLQMAERDIVDTIDCMPSLPWSYNCSSLSLLPPENSVLYHVFAYGVQKSVVFGVLEKIAYALGRDNGPSLIFVGLHVQNAAMRCRHLTGTPMTVG